MDGVDGLGHQHLTDGLDLPRGGRDELLESLMVDTQALSHGLHRFTSTLQHQPLQVVAAGDALVFAGQGGENLGDEVREVIMSGGGIVPAHNMNLRLSSPAHKS